MLSNAYFLAKFRFDTSENEPAKKMLIFLGLVILRICWDLPARREVGLGEEEAAEPEVLGPLPSGG